jgi:hypothetical protein
VALLFEEVGGDSGVHSAAQSDDDSLFDHGAILGAQMDSSAASLCVCVAGD